MHPQPLMQWHVVARLEATARARRRAMWAVTGKIFINMHIICISYICISYIHICIRIWSGM